MLYLAARFLMNSLYDLGGGPASLLAASCLSPPPSVFSVILPSCSFLILRPILSLVTDFSVKSYFVQMTNV